MSGGRDGHTRAVARQLLKEHVRSKLCTTWLPQIWRQIHSDMAPEKAIGALSDGLLAVKGALAPKKMEDEMRSRYPAMDQLVWEETSASIGDELSTVLVHCVAITVPQCTFNTMERVLLASVAAYQQLYTADRDLEEDMDVEEGDGDGGSCAELKQFWEQFQLLVNTLKSLNLLQCFISHAATIVVQEKVEEYVKEKCSQEFSEGQLDTIASSLEELLIGWLTSIYGNDEKLKQGWSPKIKYNIYCSFGKLRIEELFDIIVEFPESEAALQDLRECLLHVELKKMLVTSLKSIFQKRLLHPGANTADVITQYISSVRGLRILDPRGVVLEQVCEPLRSYLRGRDDTVRCIVASLTDDSTNELAQELATGQPVTLDFSDDCEDENQDFDTWEPDPVDANPSKSSKSRQSSDIISLLVNIYGSHEMFVSEYRNLLADRLLQSLNYDTSREIRTLELLKLRFGEGNLYFCDVMIKDIADSRRTDSYIHNELEKKRKDEQQEPSEDVQMNALILSHIFWPAFREEQIKIPAVVQRQLDAYKSVYESFKGMRTLEWRHNLGLVGVELEFGDHTLSFSVTPPRAAIIWQFEDQSTWSVEELSSALEAQSSVVRRHLGFWVSQGILRETSTDRFTVVECAQEGGRGRQGEDEDSDSAMATTEEQKESDLQVMWSYIVGMLTNLGALPLERIHTMLQMFTMQGAASSSSWTQSELKTYLDKKVKQQQLLSSGGTYQLNKNGP